MATLFINITVVNIDSSLNVDVTAEMFDVNHNYATMHQAFAVNFTTATNVTLAATISAAAKTQFETVTGVSLGTNPSYVFLGQTIGVQQYSPPPVPSFEPFPVTALSSSSHQPASIWFNKIVVSHPIAFSNVQVLKSMGAAVPAATSLNSSGTERYSYSHGLTIYTRQDYSNNSTNLVSFTTASFGLTAGLTYSSSSQTVQVSWGSDNTGGTASFSTTSSSNGWSTALTGTKAFGIPLVATFSAGEYFLAHRHSSTTGTTGSNVTLLSFANAHVGAPLFSTLGSFSGSAQAFGFGIASAVSTSMPGNSLSLNASANNWYVAFTNA